jgi:hypothetical protein
MATSTSHTPPFLPLALQPNWGSSRRAPGEGLPFGSSPCLSASMSEIPSPLESCCSPAAAASAVASDDSSNGTSPREIMYLPKGLTTVPAPP